MKLAIVGYGKMGRLIEQLAPEYGFSVHACIDIGDDFAELFDIRRAFRKQHLGRPGIVENGSKRLVQFVRDGVRHRARRAGTSNFVQ